MNRPKQRVFFLTLLAALFSGVPRHLHLAAITFRVLSGTGISQEEGKPR